MLPFKVKVLNTVMSTTNERLQSTYTMTNGFYGTGLAYTDGSAFQVNAATGVLTANGPTGFGGGGIAIDPNGKYLYSSTWSTLVGTGGIQAWQINPTDGTLTAVGPLTFINRSYDLTMHPTGKFLYVTVQTNLNPSVKSFSINSATGLLTLVNTMHFHQRVCLQTLLS